jgi:uroporphyrinogen decarboxylase
VTPAVPADEMTSKERMLTAFRHGIPDRVPVAPDISNMVPCRLTGRPFWDIYLHNDPPLWRAYLDAVRYYGFDAWFIYSGVETVPRENLCGWSAEIASRTDERIVQRATLTTPAGDLWQETTYYIADPPTTTVGLIKDLREDLPKVRYLFPGIVGYRADSLREHMAAVGDLGVVGAGIGLPGFQWAHSFFHGGCTAAIYAWYDYPDLVEELFALYEAQCLRIAEMTIEARPDFFMLGASGLWTLNSPEVFRRFALPTIKTVTRWCREAGLPSFLHSCGKQREMVAILAEETDLDVINPLEVPPMGDCDLREIKARYGHRLALMGNLHTTDVMLRGTPEKVREASMAAIDAAAAGGGFVLSTGDQCGRDTPDDNIRAMVATARDYGRYA